MNINEKNVSIKSSTAAKLIEYHKITNSIQIRKHYASSFEFSMETTTTTNNHKNFLFRFHYHWSIWDFDGALIYIICNINK